MSSGRKLYFGKFTCDLNRGRNCFRNVGLHLMKYLWEINKSVQGVPMKVKDILKLRNIRPKKPVGDQWKAETCSTLA